MLLCAFPQVIFVSSDEDKKKFLHYYGEHPWAAVPFEADVRESLGGLYGVRGIPCVVLLDAATGKVITKDARGAIQGAKTLKGLF